MTYFITTTCFGLYRPSSGCITRCRWVLLILGNYTCVARIASRDLYVTGFCLMNSLVFLFCWLVRRLWESLVVLVFFSWWVVRCWGGLFPAGRNVRVSMMVECFGRYMFFRMCLGIGYLCLGTYFCFCLKTNNLQFPIRKQQTPIFRWKQRNSCSEISNLFCIKRHTKNELLINTTSARNCKLSYWNLLQVETNVFDLRV